MFHNLKIKLNTDFVDVFMVYLYTNRNLNVDFWWPL